MSNGQSQVNLDQLCAQYGENFITNSLGVLQEEDVYMFFLYLASQAREVGKRAANRRKNTVKAMAWPTRSQIRRQPRS